METGTVTTATYTSGASTTAASSTQALDETYDLFLSVLTAQLENQSPTDPVDTEEMTSQLISYSQVEQQILSNQYLENLVLSTNNQSAETALAFIGKDVTYSASTQDYSGDALSWSMDVPANATAMTFDVVDQNGKTVSRTTETPEPGSDYTFTWDGSTGGEDTADAGTYSLNATATLDDGSTAAVSLQATSTATQVVWASGAPELVLQNGATIGLDAIVSAEQPRDATA